jgi:hypothetical protein
MICDQSKEGNKCRFGIGNAKGSPLAEETKKWS